MLQANAMQSVEERYGVRKWTFCRWVWFWLAYGLKFGLLVWFSFGRSFLRSFRLSGAEGVARSVSVGGHWRRSLSVHC